MPPPAVAPEKRTSSSRDPTKRPRATPFSTRVPVSPLVRVRLSLTIVPVMRGSASVPVARALIATGPLKSKASIAASRHSVSAAPSNIKRPCSWPCISRSAMSRPSGKSVIRRAMSPSRWPPSVRRPAAVSRSPLRSITPSTPTGFEDSTSPARLKRSIRTRAVAVGPASPTWR